MGGLGYREVCMTLADPKPRRSFLSMLTLGTAVQAQSSRGDRWQPARHATDDWFDQIPGKHRFVIDAVTPEGFGNGLVFLNNYFNANQSAYGLEDKDSAVVLVARHRATLFAYSDAFWSKYGALVQQITSFTFNDPKTGQPPTINVFNATGYGGALTNLGWTVDSLLNRGMRIAVCEISTRGYVNAIASSTGSTPDSILKEMTADLVRSARLVPAGILAVNRAQEHGYTLASAG
jgi:intracellular sulfur oxidation DsrE/DsrF family protein